MNDPETKFIKLSSWNGSGKWFTDKNTSTKPSDGTFEISASFIDIPGGGSDEDKSSVYTSEAYRETIKYQLEHQKEIYLKIMDAARQEYEKALADRDAYDPDTVDLDLPTVNSEEDLKALVRPVRLHVGFTQEKSVDSVGYEFECSWDEEHGFGVRLSDLEVEEFGYADVCF